MPRAVTAVTVGACNIFVLSYSPPMPHSIMALSTFVEWNTCSAMMVRNRKYMGFEPSPMADSLFQISKKKNANSASEIGLLCNWILSRTNRRWGDVYRPGVVGAFL